MKVLLILEASHAGVGKHVLDLSAGLVERGHTVHLIYSPLRKDTIFDARLAAMQAQGFFSHPIPMRRSPSWRDFTAVLRIRKYVRTNGPFDVIHGHSSKGGALSRLAAIGLGTPGVYTPHALSTSNPEIGALPKRAYAFIERGLSLITARVIAVSEEEKIHAVSIGISPTRLSVIENGIDLSVCNLFPDRRGELGIPEKSLVIGFVGRLSPQKDPENLLRAFASISGRFPAARLALVGTGPLKETLEAGALKMGVEGKVHFLGLRNGIEVMPSFDIFVLPSKYEGMPYVLLEASASGLPIISTKVAGAGTAVKEGRNGFLVPISDSGALAGALVRLLEDTQLRSAFSSESKRISEGFSLENMTDRTEELYALLAGEPSSARRYTSK